MMEITFAPENYIMNKALVSILINAYNEERYIAAALDSAIGQTYSEIEIIVLDDHSTDRTPDIVKSYAANLPAGAIRIAREAARHHRGAQ